MHGQLSAKNMNLSQNPISSDIMPNYAKHDTFNFTIGMILVISLLIIVNVITDDPIYVICGFIGYVFGITLFTPDLDTDSKVAHRWRHLGFIWKIYRKLTHHRGISHKPLIGTIHRIVYILIVFSPFIVIYMLVPNIPFSFMDYWKYILIAVSMIFISDLFHITLDYYYTKKKVKERQE